MKENEPQEDSPQENEPQAGGLTRRHFLEGTGGALVVAGVAPTLGVRGAPERDHRPTGS